MVFIWALNAALLLLDFCPGVMQISEKLAAPLKKAFMFLCKTPGFLMLFSVLLCQWPDA